MVDLTIDNLTYNEKEIGIQTVRTCGRAKTIVFYVLHVIRFVLMLMNSIMFLGDGK